MGALRGPLSLVGLFKPRRRPYVGIELLDDEVRAVQVDYHRGYPRLAACGRVPWLRSQEDGDQSLPAALRSLPFTIERVPVVTALPGNAVIERVLRLPPMPDEEIAAAIQYEAEEQIPVPLDDVILQHVVLGPTSDEQGVAVLLLAAPKVMVEHCADLFAEAGLTLTAIDLPALALWRLFCRTGAGGEGRGVNVVVALEKGGGRFLVVDKGLLLMTRTFSVNTDRGFDNGYDPSLFSRRHRLEAAATGEEGLYGGGGHWERLVSELQRSLEYFRNTFRGRRLERLLLTGGVADEETAARLEAALSLPVSAGEPLLRCGDKDAAVSWDPGLAVAAGLALWGVEG